MLTPQSLQNLDAAKQWIHSFNFNPIIERLINTDGWKREHAIEACEQYKNYLILLKKHSDQAKNLPPSYDIDEVWHAHILFTEIYTDFCNQFFGKYLHHSPYHGQNQNNEKITEDQLENMFEKTQELYKTEFNDYIYAVQPLPLKVQIKRAVKKVKSLVS